MVGSDAIGVAGLDAIGVAGLGAMGVAGFDAIGVAGLDAIGVAGFGVTVADVERIFSLSADPSFGVSRTALAACVG